MLTAAAAANCPLRSPPSLTPCPPRRHVTDPLYEGIEHVGVRLGNTDPHHHIGTGRVEVEVEKRAAADFARRQVAGSGLGIGGQHKIKSRGTDPYRPQHRLTE